MAVRLVALDIDGTLIEPAHYGHDHLPGAAITQAVRALVDSGVAVILASGRMFPGTAKVARHLGLQGPVICQQGCSIHLINGQMTHQFPIEHEIAVEIIRFAREIGRDYEWFNPLRYIASAESPATVQYGTVSGIRPEYRPDPEHSGVEPTGVGVISTHEAANGIHRQLVAHYRERLHVLDFPDVTVAVAPDANKGHALELLCDDMGVSRHEVVAVGDSVNDASMLAWAGRGIAMAHADAYARDAATEILADDSGALANLLSTLVS